MAVLRGKSEALGMDIKFDDKKGILTVNDRIPPELKKRAFVEYSMEEMEIIKRDLGEIDLTVHNVKKHFDGIIIDNKKEKQGELF